VIKYHYAKGCDKVADYMYVAVDIDGKEKKGKIEAQNEERVYSSLRSEGLFPIAIKEQTLLNKDINFSFTQKIKARDYSVFARQFVSIISAGVPIIKALEMIVEQTENKTLKKGLQDTKILVEKGEKLADAMRNQGKIFPPILINMVEAGELSGSLEIALDRMATHFEKEAKLKALVKKAMIYPIAVGCVALSVIILMLVVVIPSFMKMFNDMNIKMPVITMAAVSMSNFLVHKWYIVLIVVGLIAFGFITFKKSYKGQVILAKIALKMPIFGSFIIKSSCARFSRTLSTLIAAGIPLIEAIDITARTIDNVVIKKVLYDAKEEVARGVPLSVPLMTSGIFPPMLNHMTKIGEETGMIESMLVKVADYYDEEVEIASQTLTAAMEPLIIIVLALVVGLLIAAIMQPLFTMYDSLDTLGQ
jgi:Type II secretory pathway, component PulF